METRITGQVVMRPTTRITPDGRHLMIVIGIIAVPGMEFDARYTEYMYTVVGQRGKGDDMLPTFAKLTVLSPQPTPVDTLGMDVAGMLLEPMWRY